MQENICSIPINDVFMPKKGCPMCRMRNMLEERRVDYVTGSAMMEPDVRIVTNQLGFCHTHFAMMLKQGKRLSNALILESHLKKISEELMPKQTSGKPNKKTLEALSELTKTCFVCKGIAENMENMCRIIYSMWQSEPEFKRLYEEQEYICLEHFSLLMSNAAKPLGRSLPEFYASTSKLAGGYLESLCGDVSHFCKMFDYRSAGEDWGNSKDSIERAVEFLTSRHIETNYAGNEESEE